MHLDVWSDRPALILAFQKSVFVDANDFDARPREHNSQGVRFGTQPAQLRKLTTGRIRGASFVSHRSAEGGESNE